MNRPKKDPIFERAFEDAGIAMALVGLDGRWLYVNRALCHLIGYSADELQKRTCRDVTHSEDVDLDTQQFQYLLSGQSESFDLKKRYVHRLGHPVPVHQTTSLLHEDNGRPRLFITQIQTISEANPPEENEAVFELPAALHFVAGFDGYFKKLSRSWKDALGYPLETLLSRPYLEFVHPKDRQRTVDEAASVERGGEAVLFENRYLHANGTYRWLLWTAMPVISEKLIYGVAVDFTDRKCFEMELLAALQEQCRLYTELQQATAHIQELRSGLLKVCAWTKRVFHEGQWIPTDEFLRDHLQLNLTHGISEEGAKQFLSDLPPKSDSDES